MDKMTLCVAVAPLSWNGKEFEIKSKAYLSLDEISLERGIEDKSKEEDGLIV